MNEYKVFKALGEKTRYSIVLKLLNTKNNCCTNLASFTKKDLSTISRQLSILKKENIIEITKINKTKCIKLKNKTLVLKIINDIKKIKGDEK
jgi:DNA-binding transcriptional ArsR family regulator